MAIWDNWNEYDRKIARRTEDKAKQCPDEFCDGECWVMEPFTRFKYVTDDLKYKAIKEYFEWVRSCDNYRYMWE